MCVYIEVFCRQQAVTDATFFKDGCKCDSMPCTLIFLYVFFVNVCVYICMCTCVWRCICFCIYMHMEVRVGIKALSSVTHFFTVLKLSLAESVVRQFAMQVGQRAQGPSSSSSPALG